MTELLPQVPEMLLALFQLEPPRIFRGQRGKKSSFGHAYGDPVGYGGLRYSPRQPPVHVLFRLNLADPAIGVRLPSSEWLPLLCAIRYGACALAYRVLADNKVKIVHQQEKKAWDGFPYDNYPERLPVKPLAFKERLYDPDNLDQVLSCWGVFGLSHLNDKQMDKLKRFVVKKKIYDPRFSFSPDVESFLEEGVGWPFVQGPPPSDRCPYPRCKHHKKGASLRTFAIFEEEDRQARKLWGPNGENLQIIYQICPDCSTIMTTNQCT